ncbi:hypothetical protein WQ57_13920 [Mesobacillus campisalis]|uniref:Uncharacterized protein n=1 Tax=Mesobacillus campisalis TaxID=1408103 RepID=A0A0M2SY37_9BACI|nr:cysteine-rich VLP protein [Mesobacillus campisalis]KKK37530.1 hypothetical protein WQ57_13920 [Mesobacillus campisalis]
MSFNATLNAFGKLAESNCANLINGRCLGERGCPVVIQALCEGFRCPYFEAAVLPADPELQERYSVHVLKQGRAAQSSKKCKGCSRLFKTGNFRVQYCSDTCRNHGKKKANRISDKKYRKKREISTY